MSEEHTTDDPAQVDVHVDVPTTTPEPEPAPDTTVVVEHQEPQPAPATIVVASDSGDSIPAPLVDFMVETRETLQRLQQEVGEARSDAATAVVTSEATSETLGEAVGSVQEVADGVAAQITGAQPTSTPEDDVSPHKPHPWFRPVKRTRR